MSDRLPRTSLRADAWALLFALTFPTLSVLIYFVLLPGADASKAVQQAAYVAGKVLQFGFPLFWVLAIQRRRLRFPKPVAKGLVEGLLFGLFVFAAILALYFGWLGPGGHLEEARKPISDRLSAYGLTSVPTYVLFALFVSLAHSFLEEYYWRWFTFGELRRLMPVWVAIAVSSLGFMGHHVFILGTYFGYGSLPTVVFSLAVALGGGVWAWIYHRSGSLYGPWLSHLFVDAAIFVVGYDMVGSSYFAS
jgi:membrane protease YdiL (CAAX protease family)